MSADTDNRRAQDDPQASRESQEAGRAQGRGELERFVAEFNAFEQEKRLFERCIDADGVAWWDAARYAVQFRLCQERELHRTQRPVRRTIPARAKALLRNGARLILSLVRAARLDGRRRFSGIYLYGRSDKVLEAELASKVAPCLVIGDVGLASSDHYSIDKRCIEYCVGVVQRFCKTPAPTVAVARDVVKMLNIEFAPSSNILELILRKRAQYRAGLVVWRWLLQRIGHVPVVGFIGDDSQKPLICLAREAGIRTREFQHGYIGGSHINYSYPPDCAELSTLPDEIVVSLDTGDIRYPVQRIQAPSFEVKPIEGPREIDVLVGASPTRVDEAFEITDVLVATGLRVAVKLHPNQSIHGSGFRERYAHGRLEVYGGEVEFKVLAASAKAYVPANPTSTTSFEAVAAGARLVVVDFGGLRLTSSIDRIVFARVNDPARLPDALRKLFGDDGSRA